MKLRIIAFIAFLVVPSLAAQVEKCQGWKQTEETKDYVIVEHFHSDRCVQTIQITNNGNMYFLLAGPYGFDQFLLNGILPRKFPIKYFGKCCWLRRTKVGDKLVMTYSKEEPQDILIGN